MNWIELQRLNFFCILLFLFCGTKYPELREESQEKGSTLKFLNFERIEYKGGGQKKWKLKAKEAYIYNKKNSNELEKISLYHIDFEQYLPKKSSMKGNYAILDYKNNKFKIEGDAIYSDDDLELKGKSLSYDLEKEILETDIPVQIKRKSSTIIVCKKGFYYNKNEDIQICRSPSGSILQNPKKDRQNREEKNKFFF